MTGPAKVMPILVAGLVALASGCGGDDTSGSAGAPQSAGGGGDGKQVLPVRRNPLENASGTPGLTITKALVENNENPATGKAVDDHLEVVLKNTSRKPLDRISVYYKISDHSKGLAEGYYAKLDGFSIEPGKSRVAHFDNTGAKDHFAVNKFSLYYTDKNELVVDVMAGAPGVKPAKFQVRKDSAGAEAGVE